LTPYWKILGQVIRFCLASIPGFASYLLFYYVFTKAGIAPALSVILAVVIKRAIGFLIQKFFTFRNKEMRTVPQQASLYVIMFASITLLNSGSVWLLVEKFHFEKMTAPLYPMVPLGILSFLAMRRIFS